MSEEYGSDYITLTGDNGEEIEVEHLGTLEVEGALYAAFTDADPKSEDEAELYILRFQEEGEDGENVLVTVDDEQELEKVYNLFLDSFAQEEPDQTE